jgi:hypothetical protein
MPRQARLDTFGTLHHVIFRGIEKGLPNFIRRFLTGYAATYCKPIRSDQINLLKFLNNLSIISPNSALKALFNQAYS